MSEGSDPSGTNSDLPIAHRLAALDTSIRELRRVVHELVTERERCWQAWERHLAWHGQTAALLAELDALDSDS